MRLALGVLISHGFPAPSPFWDSYEQVMLSLTTGASNVHLPEGRKVTGVRRIKSQAFPPDVARNDIVRDFLRGDEDYLLFLDADMTFPADIAGRLLAHDKAVVTARYHMRREPYHAVAYVKHRIVDGPHAYAPVHWGRGLIEIERGGAGALLIRRDVLEAIGGDWFRYQRGPEPPHDYTVSEDFWFYRRARECGFSCWLDWDCECEHLQTFGINRSWNEAYLDAQVRALPSLPPEERQRALNGFVVCGMPDGLRLSSGDHVPAYIVTAGER